MECLSEKYRKKEDIRLVMDQVVQKNTIEDIGIKEEIKKRNNG